MTGIVPASPQTSEADSPRSSDSKSPRPQYQRDAEARSKTKLKGAFTDLESAFGVNEKDKDGKIKDKGKAVSQADLIHWAAACVR